MTIDHFPNRTARDREADTVRALTDRHTRERAALARVETLAEAIDRKILADVQVEDMHHALAVVVRTYSRVFLFGFDEGSAGAKMEFYWSLYNDPSDLDEGELPDEQNDTGLTVRDDDMDACIAKALDILDARQPGWTLRGLAHMEAIAEGIGGEVLRLGPDGRDPHGIIGVLVAKKITDSGGRERLLAINFDSGTLGFTIHSDLDWSGGDVDLWTDTLDAGTAKLFLNEEDAVVAYCALLIEQWQHPNKSEDEQQLQVLADSIGTTLSDSGGHILVAEHYIDRPGAARMITFGLLDGLGWQIDAIPLPEDGRAVVYGKATDLPSTDNPRYMGAVIARCKSVIAEEEQK